MKPYNKINKLQDLDNETNKKLIIDLILNGDVELIRLSSRFLEMLETEYKKQPLLKPLIEATLRNKKLEEENKKIKEKFEKEKSKMKQTEHINLFLGIIKTLKRQIEFNKIENVNEIFDDLGDNINTMQKMKMYKDIIRAFITQEEEDLLIRNINIIDEFVKRHIKEEETQDDYIFNIMSNVGFDEEDFDEEEKFDFEKCIIHIKNKIDNYKEEIEELQEDNIEKDKEANYNMIMLMTTYGQTHFNRVKEEYLKSSIDNIDSIISFVDNHLLEKQKSLFFEYIKCNVYKNENEVLKNYDIETLDDLDDDCINYYSTLWSNEIITID